jgi:nicotinate-nucleotide pyrophosphorylase (carboxylating)
MVEHTPSEPFDVNAVRDLLRLSLTEDVGPGDITTDAIIDPHATAEGVIVSHEAGVMAGGPMVDMVFKLLGSEASWTWFVSDGQPFETGTVLGKIRSRAAVLLTGERLALNILQRLCGIAFLTRQFVKRLAGTGVFLLDTRKTSPGLRILERYAVRKGGGVNHRFGLFDRVLIKENHLVFVADPAEAIRQARTKYPDTIIEIEVSSEEEFQSALSAHPDWILLDNMPIILMKRCVEIRDGDQDSMIRLEASGGVRLNTIAEIASTGIDAISAGALTHSAVWLDLSMDVNHG